MLKAKSSKKSKRQLAELQRIRDDKKSRNKEGVRYWGINDEESMR